MNPQKRPHRLLISALLILGLSQPIALHAAPHAYPKTQEILASQIDAIMQASHVVGLSIALVDDQTVVWSQGFGYADQAQGRKATPDTMFRAGSISKLFTATAAMQLAEQGKLDIDQPVQNYVPKFAMKSRFPGTEPITPRLLMTHHAGLPDTYLKGALTAESFGERVENLGEEYVAYPPNLLLTYSNLGFTLLGRAVENACGQPFSACLAERLLQPLGMAQSGFATGATSSPLMSKGYAGGQEAPPIVLRDVPAGGLNSTVLDLSRFVEMVFADGGKTIGSAPLAEMLRQQNEGLALDLDAQMGLGWFLNRNASGQPTAWHNGSDGVFNSMLVIAPGKKLGVVVLSNSAEGGGVVLAVATAALELMLAEQSGSATRAEAIAAPLAAKLPKGAKGYLGNYASEFGAVRIARQGQGLSLNLNGARTALSPQAEGGFLAPATAFGDLPLKRADIAGHALLVMGLPGERQILGEKLAAPNVPAAWLARLGKYRVINPDTPESKTPLSLSYRNGFLFLKSGALPERMLAPVNDQEAVFAGLGRGLGETVAAEERDGRTYLRYSGYVLEQRPGRGTRP